MTDSLYPGELPAVYTPQDSLDATRACGIGGLLGESSAMQRLFEQIVRVASSNASVLIVGESGTGKELVARCLHELSPRCNQPFIAVNCGALPMSLMEAELFGEERNGTDGARPHHGYFARAGSGTLLLDEITEMPLDMQLRMLDVLQSGRWIRARDGRAIEIRCRIVAATRCDPDQAVAEGRLRSDLLDGLGIFQIPVPPLREREDDAELLAGHFLAALNAEEGTDKQLSEQSKLALRKHLWPGNIRELRNAVHRAFILTDDQLDLSSVVGSSVVPASQDAQVLRIPVGTNLSDAERWMIVATLKKCGGNKTRAAALLGVSLKTLYNRLNAYRAEGRNYSDMSAELSEVWT